MDNEKSNDNLPACPVETTLMLIGDKWKVLIKKIYWQSISKSLNNTTS